MPEPNFNKIVFNGQESDVDRDPALMAVELKFHAAQRDGSVIVNKAVGTQAKDVFRQKEGLWDHKLSE